MPLAGPLVYPLGGAGVSAITGDGATEAQPQASLSAGELTVSGSATTSASSQIDVGAGMVKAKKVASQPGGRLGFATVTVTASAIRSVRVSARRLDKGGQDVLSR